MNPSIDAVGRSDPWVKDNQAVLAKRVVTAMATAVGEDATHLARRLNDGQSLTDIVGRRGLARESVRDAIDQELRRDGRTPRDAVAKADALIDHLSRRRSNREQAGVAGLAEMLGMTVGELVSALDHEGVTIQQLFRERGIFPAPGTITDLAL